VVWLGVIPLRLGWGIHAAWWGVVLLANRSYALTLIVLIGHLGLVAACGHPRWAPCLSLSILRDHQGRFHHLDHEVRRGRSRLATPFGQVGGYGGALRALRCWLPWCWCCLCLCGVGRFFLWVVDVQFFHSSCRGGGCAARAGIFVRSVPLVEFGALDRGCPQKSGLRAFAGA